MAQSRARLLPLEDVRASVRRLQHEGERLVGRLQHNARRLVRRRGKSVIDRVLALAAVRKLRADVQQRAERAVKDLETRRTRLVAGLQGQLEHLADPVVKELRGTTREVKELKRRIAHVERRLAALAKVKPRKDQAA